ncbi:MAG: DUF362 domain-containing protein [Anaerolineae bacterium]
MGKLKNLAMVKSTSADSFAYLPPDSAFDAMRILVKPTLGEGYTAPAIVSMSVLGAVLRGLRRASPGGRIVIMDSVRTDGDPAQLFEEVGVTDLLDAEMRVTDTDNLIVKTYSNRLDPPCHFASLRASEYISDYDCVISLSAFKRTLVDSAPRIAGSVANLRGFFPRAILQQFESVPYEDVLTDVYFTIGQHVDGAVIDLSAKYASDDARLDRGDVGVPVGKVVWGDDLLAVDEVACQLADEPVPSYLTQLRDLRKQLAGA